MNEVPSLVQDLALILLTAAVVTIIFKKLKQPLVLGYIVAGIFVSPNLNVTMSVIDEENIETWANIGVMFLLFALGLDFSFKKILKMGLAPIIAALTVVFSMMMIGIFVSELFGWSSMTGMFMAGMLAMSSTTIIYKAFDDLGLRQQQFSSLVMSVLILEDILAIVLMVVLTTVARGDTGDNSMMLSSITNIGFFLILWFVVGLFFIPTLLRKTRNLINDEVLLIIALALCCGMAVCAALVGFSAAFGSFVMGSILAETVEAKKIEKLIEPVKNLFGAIFFVSVGMLVDIAVVAEQWLPIVVITLAILLGQSIFGSFGFMLSGQPLKTAMRCGFSMAQIGEFAFIIASLGMSLHVLEGFVYPVVVTVSVITTFLTPYMIRGAVPVYNVIEAHLSKTWIRRINRISDIAPSNTDSSEGYWKPLFTQMFTNTLIYSVLTTAILSIMRYFGAGFIQSIIPHPWDDIICGIITIVLMAPFLRAMVMKKNKSEEFKALWISSRHNRAPLVFTIIVRVVIAMVYIYMVCAKVIHVPMVVNALISAVIVAGIVYSRGMKKSSIHLERLFLQNLHSKDIAAKKNGKRPIFSGKLIDHNLHISEITVPQDSLWAGKTLAELSLGKKFGIHISSIQRGRLHVNIPSGSDFIFPNDILHVIGNDEQLMNFNNAMTKEVIVEPDENENHEMQLRRFVVKGNSILLNKSLITSELRDKFNCMLIGMEEDEVTISRVSPAYNFQKGDILWIVGEEPDIKRLAEQL